MEDSRQVIGAKCGGGVPGNFFECARPVFWMWDPSVILSRRTLPSVAFFAQDKILPPPLSRISRRHPSSNQGEGDEEGGKGSRSEEGDAAGKAKAMNPLAVISCPGGPLRI